MGQLNTGSLLNIFCHHPTPIPTIGLGSRQRAGRPMGSGVGVKGSTEVFGRMTGKTVDGAAEKLNTGRFLNILAAIHLHLQLQHSDKQKIILKYLEGGGFVAPNTSTHCSMWAAFSAAHDPVTPHPANNCHISWCSAHEVGLPGVQSYLSISTNGCIYEDDAPL